MTIIAYKGRGRQPWRWRLVARNGRIIADSAEGYSTRSNLRRAATRLTGLIRDAGWIEIQWR